MAFALDVKISNHDCSNYYYKYSYSKDDKSASPQFCKQNPTEIWFVSSMHGLTMICHDNLCLSLANLITKVYTSEEKLRPPVSPSIGFEVIIDGVGSWEEHGRYVIIGASYCRAKSKNKLTKWRNSWELWLWLGYPPFFSNLLICDCNKPYPCHKVSSCLI